MLKAYCTATPNLHLSDPVAQNSAPAEQPYLITDVEHDKIVTASLLFLRQNGSYNASDQLNTDLFTSTSCDKAKLKDPVTVLLAGFKVFAKADLSGTAVCSYNAGVLTGTLEDSRAIGSSSWVVKVQCMSADCQGIDHGYTENGPNVLPPVQQFTIPSAVQPARVDTIPRFANNWAAMFPGAARMRRIPCRGRAKFVMKQNIPQLPRPGC